MKKKFKIQKLLRIGIPLIFIMFHILSYGLIFNIKSTTELFFAILFYLFTILFILYLNTCEYLLTDNKLIIKNFFTKNKEYRYEDIIRHEYATYSYQTHIILHIINNRVVRIHAEKPKEFISNMLAMKNVAIPVKRNLNHTL